MLKGNYKFYLSRNEKKKFLEMSLNQTIHQVSAKNNSLLLHIESLAKIVSSRPRTTDTWWLNPWFFAAQIQIPIPNKYLGFGYKGLVFCRNNGWLMGADKSTKSTLNAPKFICPCPKVWYFNKKCFIGRPYYVPIYDEYFHKYFMKS